MASLLDTELTDEIGVFYRGTVWQEPRGLTLRQIARSEAESRYEAIRHHRWTTVCVERGTSLSFRHDAPQVLVDLYASYVQHVLRSMMR